MLEHAVIIEMIDHRVYVCPGDLHKEVDVTCRTDREVAQFRLNVFTRRSRHIPDSDAGTIGSGKRSAGRPSDACVVGAGEVLWVT